MGDTVRYKGILRKIERLEGESDNALSLRLTGELLSPDCDTIEDYLYSYHYKRFVACHKGIYEIVNYIGEDTNVEFCDLTENDDGTIEFDAMFYNDAWTLSETLARYL